MNDAQNALEKGIRKSVIINVLGDQSKNENLLVICF